MWTNKHLVTALIVAPILAILAWFAVDYFVSDEPQAAVPGAAYELMASGSCFHASGRCELGNGEFLITLELQSDDVLLLSASHALDGVQVAIGRNDAFEAPRPLQQLDPGGTSWQGPLAEVPADGSLRLLASAGGSSYYVETSLAFAGGGESP